MTTAVATDPIARLQELKREFTSVRETLTRCGAELVATREELLALSIDRRVAFEKRARGVAGAGEEIDALEQRTREAARKLDALEQEAAGAGSAEKNVAREIRTLYDHHADAFIEQAETASKQAKVALLELRPALAECYDLWQKAAALWQPLVEARGLSVPPRCPLPHASELSGATPRPKDMSGNSAGLRVESTSPRDPLTPDSPAGPRAGRPAGKEAR